MFDEPLILVEEEGLFCGLTIVFQRDNITKKGALNAPFVISTGFKPVTF